VVAFASVPSAHIGSLSWLVAMLWIVAYLVWLIVIWAVIDLVRAHAPQRVSLRGRLSPATPIGVLIGVLVITGLVGVWRLRSQSTVNSAESTQVSNVVQTVEHNIRPGVVAIKFWPQPFILSIGAVGHVEYQYGQAIMWQLTTAGYQPLMPPLFTVLSAITYPLDPSSPKVNVIMNDQGSQSQIERVVIGAYRPPVSRQLMPLHTTVQVPSNGATVGGASVVLDASATAGDVTKVEFVVSSGSLSDHVVGTASPTLEGWIAEWDTTTVPNGTYMLQSVASGTGAVTAMSPAIRVTVENRTP
jgi:hypothetical protein